MGCEFTRASAADAQYYYRLCLSCAHGVYLTRAPSNMYATRVARQLYGTGAHESGGWRWTRQRGYRLTDLGGAFGMWQCERNTIVDIRRWLRFGNLDLRMNAAQWYFGTDDAAAGLYQLDEVLEIELNVLLAETCANPRLSVLWARLVYLRDPDPVPESIEDQADYWGRVYNTRREPAKNAQWAAAYRKWGKVLDDDVLA